MNRLTKFSILIFAILILANSVHAASFDAKVTAINDKIVVDETAQFQVTIQNYLPTDEDFTIKKAGYPFWDMYTEPLQNPITLKVAGNSSASITLFVHPLYITSVDTYTLDTGIVLQRTGEEQKVPVTIGIKSTDPMIGGYIPTVLANVDVPEKVDPREPVRIKVLMSNQNVINYSNLTLKIEGGLISGRVDFPLEPKEDKTVEFEKKLDGMTAPQADKLIISVFKDSRLIVNPIAKEFEVVSYAVREDLPQERHFLKIRRGIMITTNNPDYTGLIRVETSPLKNLFSSTSPRAQVVKENGHYYFVWDVKPGPSRKITVYATENYRLLVVIFVLAAAFIALYFLFRSPMIVRKSIAHVSMAEGGISEVKIVVRVKNRSPKQLTAIEVIDNAPHIAQVEKELSVGSIQPHAILQHPRKGVMIKWNVESLEAGDERVLSYKIKSRLSILGEFSLPAATARTKIGNKVIITNSNRVSIGG